MIKKLNKNYFNVKLYIWISFLPLSIIFILFPQIDITISAPFYNGDSFYLKGSTFERFFYNSVKVLLTAFTVGSLGIYIYNRIKKTNILNLNTKVIIYIVLVLGVAPGLIVNATLKDNWGCARPVQIKEFGGTKTFTPTFILSDIITSFFIVWIITHIPYKLIFKKDSTL